MATPIFLMILLSLVYFWIVNREPVAKNKRFAPNFLEGEMVTECPIKVCKTYIDDKGYSRFNDSHRLVHRWVVEKNIGRRLDESEVVHHIDGNKRHNSIDNLQVCLYEEHNLIHLDNLRETGNWYGWKNSC